MVGTLARGWLFRASGCPTPTRSQSPSHSPRSPTTRQLRRAERGVDLRGTGPAELRPTLAVATLKDDLHVVGRQGSVIDEFTERVTAATISYLDSSEAADTA